MATEAKSDGLVKSVVIGVLTTVLSTAFLYYLGFQSPAATEGPPAAAPTQAVVPGPPQARWHPSPLGGGDAGSIALIAAVFGFGVIANAAASIAKILFFIFLVVFITMLILGLVRLVRRMPV